MINERRAFGERLRRQREKQNITLNQIAASTKVAASLFAGLEKGDCSRWPGGMYNRAFIRGYAAAVRLDPDDVAAEFAEYYSASAESPPALGQSAPGPPGQRDRAVCAPPQARTGSGRTAPARGTPTGARRRGRSRRRHIAGIVAFATGTAYWSALAIFSLGYQVAMRLLSGLSPAERLLARGRRNQRPLEEEHEDEAPVAGTASTVA